MYRSGGLAGIILIFGSIYYVSTGMWRLFRHCRYRELLYTLSFLSLGGTLIYFLFSMGWNRPTGELRIWFAAPGIILFLIWILSGFFVRQYVDAVLAKNNDTTSMPQLKTTIQRCIGGILITTSIIVWVYGVIHPLSKDTFIYGLLTCLGLLIFGMRLAVKGTRLDDRNP